jgi:hypothetical protein
MAFCSRCNKEVHTSVKIQGNTFTRFWEKVLNCCGNMMWFEKKKVHKCPICQETVGYSRY